VAAVAVLLVAAGCASGNTGVAAGCGGPEVRLAPTTAAPGDDVRLRARFLWSDCYDTGQRGTPPPLRGVPVTFQADGRTVRLATVDAEPDGSLDMVVRVPEDAAPGDARILVGSAAADITVEGQG
jgi:hypothetical protein